MVSDNHKFLAKFHKNYQSYETYVTFINYCLNIYQNSSYLLGTEQHLLEEQSCTRGWQLHHHEQNPGVEGVYTRKQWGIIVLYIYLLFKLSLYHHFYFEVCEATWNAFISQQTHMPGNLWPLMWKCCELSSSDNERSWSIYFSMQAAGCSKKWGANIMKMFLCLCGPTK